MSNPILPPVEQMHPRVAELYRLWQSLRPTPDLLPPRRAFDPMAVPRLLPNVYLIKVVGDPPRFQFRLLGEAIVLAGGPGRRGKFVDEIHRSGTPAYLHDQLAALVAAGRPNYYKGPPTLEHNTHVRLLEGIMLPMAEDGVHADHVLCLTVYYWADGSVG